MSHENKTIRVSNIITNIFIVLTAMLVILITSLQLSGVRPYAVTTDSMSNVFQTGDAICIIKTDFSKLEVNDIITVRYNNEKGYFTHRIVELDKENELVWTKGDMNKSNDPMPAKKTQIVGRYLFSISGFGNISLKMIEYKNIALIIFGLVVALVIFIRVLLQMKYHSKKQKN